MDATGADDTVEPSAFDHQRLVSDMPFMSRAKPIETVTAGDLDPRDFRNYVETNRPLIIRGAAGHWPALERWPQPDYLVRRTEGQTVNLYPHVNYMTAARHHQGRRNVPFAEAWEVLHEERDEPAVAAWAISNTAIFPAPPHVYDQLCGDVPGYEFLPDPDRAYLYPDFRGFLYRNAGTGWHYHETDCTLMTQVIGRKVLGLLPPDSATWHTVATPFVSDAYFEDPACFGPAANSLQPQIGTLEAGDAAFLPPFWWHGVEANDGFGITVPFCWRAPLRVVGDLSIPANRRFIRHLLRRPHKKTSARLLAAAALGSASRLLPVSGPR